jgi:uncharacterized protein
MPPPSRNQSKAGNPDDQLIIFVKAPRPGQVKTRLAIDLGPEAACSAYCRLAEALFLNLAGLRGVELQFSPEDARAEIEPWRRPSWRLRPQARGNLGERLGAAFQNAFGCGSRCVVIIGSDCPEITQTDINDAWAALRTHDLVLGPALDGGYWLVGLRQPQPLLFEGIAWSTSSVCDETVRRARRAGLKLKLLRELSDIDTAVDWREFLAKD